MMIDVPLPSLATTANQPRVLPPDFSISPPMRYPLASASDAGVAALAALAAIRGAELNVRINASSLSDTSAAAPLLKRAAEILAEAQSLQDQVLEAVNDNIKI